MSENATHASNLTKCPDGPAVIADAHRAATACGEAVAQALRAAGITTTQNGVDRWRRRVPPLTEAQRAEIWRRRADIQAGAFRPERRLRSTLSE